MSKKPDDPKDTATPPTSEPRPLTWKFLSIIRVPLTGPLTIDFEDCAYEFAAPAKRGLPLYKLPKDHPLYKMGYIVPVPNFFPPNVYPRSVFPPKGPAPPPPRKPKPS